MCGALVSPTSCWCGEGFPSATGLSLLIPLNCGLFFTCTKNIAKYYAKKKNVSYLGSLTSAALHESILLLRFGTHWTLSNGVVVKDIWKSVGILTEDPSDQPVMEAFADPKVNFRAITEFILCYLFIVVFFQVCLVLVVSILTAVVAFHKNVTILGLHCRYLWRRFLRLGACR